MKKLLLISSLLTGTFAGFLHAQGSLTPEILYYKFDEVGTNVTNYASAPPPGTATATIMGGLSQGGLNICQGTMIGSGASSSTDYLNTNWATSLTGSWSIAFRTSNFGPSGTLFYIFGDVNAGSFRCFTNGVAGPNNWILRGTGITDAYINGGAVIAPHMCVYVYDQTVNTIYGYLDGVLVSTTVQAGTPVIVGTGPFKVVGYSTNVGAPLDGYLDEFRVYSRVLTGAEIVELYNPFATADFLGADQYSCPGDTTTLSFPDLPYGTLTWSDATSADSLLVPNPGTYSVIVSGNCGAGEDSITFISSATTSSISPASCDMYMAPSGDTLSTSGTYNDTITNVVGCDSVITINLTIENGSSASISPTECLSYLSPGGNTYSSTGTYTDTIPNFIGCDSVITINLTIASPNTNVTQAGTSGENLTATGTGTFTWIDCGTNVPVGVSTAAYTATANGTYAVVVDNGTCIDTSSCYVVSGLSIDNNTLANLVKIYPNPTHGQFNIALETTDNTFTLELMNNVGQVIKNTLFTNTNIGNMEITGPNGLYFIRITKSNGEKATLRVVKD